MESVIGVGRPRRPQAGHRRLGGAGVGVLMLAAIFAQVLPVFFSWLSGSGHGRLSVIVARLNVMSTNKRHRLDAVLAGLGLPVISHGLNVLVFFLIGKKMPFGSRVTAMLAQHFLMVPLTLFTMAVPLPFGTPGLTEGVGDQLLKLVGHPSGAMAVTGLCLVMYGCGLVGACVYLANLNEVRALTASVHYLEDALTESEWTEEGCVSQDRGTLKNIIGEGSNTRLPLQTRSDGLDCAGLLQLK